MYRIPFKEPRNNSRLNTSFFDIISFVPLSRNPKSEFELDSDTWIEVKESGQQLAEDKYGLSNLSDNALYKSTNKYAKVIPCFHTETLTKAENAMYKHFMPHMGNSRFLTDEEALVSMNKTSSPGFGYNRYKTKNELFDKDFHWFEMNVDRLTNDWKRGICTVVPWINSLKDEKRLFEKIESESTRTFTMCPADMSFIGTKILGDQNDKLHKANRICSSKVGINPYNQGWNNLHDYLDKWNTKFGFDLDVKEYDSSLAPVLFSIVTRFRFLCLKPELRTVENWRLICCYYSNIVFSVIVNSDGTVYIKFGGNPSGQPSTAEDNTLILYLLFAYLYFKKFPHNSFKQFEKDVKMALYGDDNTVVAELSLWRQWPFGEVVKSAKDINFTITCDCSYPRPTDELTFLSKRFSVVGSMYGFVIDRDRVLATLKYRRKGSTLTDLISKLHSCLHLTYNDKPMYYFIKEIIEAVSEECELPEEKEALSKIFSDSELYALHFHPSSC